MAFDYEKYICNTIQYSKIYMPDFSKTIQCPYNTTLILLSLNAITFENYFVYLYVILPC